MPSFLIDILDHDERKLINKATLFGLNNWLDIYAHNTLRIPKKVQASVVDDLVASDGATRPKLKIETESHFSETQMHALSRYAVWYVLFWRHGLPVTPYVIESEPDLPR